MIPVYIDTSYYHPIFITHPDDGTVTCDLISDINDEHIIGGTAPNRKLALALAVQVLKDLEEEQ